jgi:hypothetical protein
LCTAKGLLNSNPNQQQGVTNSINRRTGTLNERAKPDQLVVQNTRI